MAVLPLQELSPDLAAAPRTDAAPARQGAPLQPRSGPTMLLLAAIILALSGVGFWTWSQFVRPVEVRIAPVQTDVREQVFGLGTVGARVASNVGFKVAGVLVDLTADHGDHVRSGAVLARLDARDVEAQLVAARAGVSQAEANIGKARADEESAQANLTNAQAVSARRADLARSGYASKEEAQSTEAAMRVARANLDVAGSEVGVANAALEAAKAQVVFAQATLDNDTLRAPYDALVVARNLNLGSMPVPGQAVFNLVDPQTIWVLGYVNERLAGSLQLGQKAEIVPALPPRGAPGGSCRPDRDPERSGQRGAAGQHRLRCHPGRHPSGRTSGGVHRHRCPAESRAGAADCRERPSRRRRHGVDGGAGAVGAAAGFVRAGTGGRQAADRRGPA